MWIGELGFRDLGFRAWGRGQRGWNRGIDPEFSHYRVGFGFLVCNNIHSRKNGRC